MAVLFTSWWMDLYFVLFVFVAGHYIHFKLFTSQYWKKRNFPHLEPVFIFGNTWRAAIVDNMIFILSDMYRNWKEKKVVGYWSFSRPFLVVTDLDIVKNVLTRDFSYFRDRKIQFDSHNDPLAANLFNLKGAKWRNLRVKLTPTFSSGKMKMMFPTMVTCGKQLQEYLKKVAEMKEGVEVKEIMGRFTTDIISQCAFGIETNTLENPNSDFRKYGKKVFDPDLKAILKGILSRFSPLLFKLLKLKFISQDMTDFFVNTVRDTMEYREKNKVMRNDFMQLLIQLKKKGKLDDVDGVVPDVLDGYDTPVEDIKFSFSDAAAQAFVFFVAGFETASSTMTFALYELSLNPDIQERLQKEIDETLAKTGGEMTYDGILNMEYLDWVVQETLRKHPPVGFLFRECSKDYEIPELNLTVPKDAGIMIPNYAIQWDPEYFPNPEKFDPERFSPEEKSRRHHYATLPFGEGPRNCIGSRFGLLQTKVGLVSILSKNSVSVTTKTRIPLKYSKRSFVLSSDSGVWLRFVPRQ